MFLKTPIVVSPHEGQNYILKLYFISVDQKYFTNLGNIHINNGSIYLHIDHTI